MSFLIRCSFILFLFLSFCNLNAQFYDAELISQKHFKKISQPIKFDGVVEKSEWPNTESMPLVSHWPAYSETPNKQTTLFAGYDDKYLYFASICYEEIADIRTPTFERDILEMNMDIFAIIIDPYNDNENAQQFAVTPTGSRIDLSTRNDAQGDFPIDLSWNSFWEAKVSKFDEGWMAEIRIPFTSLRYQPIDNKVKMGMILFRYSAKDGQMDIFPKIQPNWGFWSFIKPSQAQDVEIEKSSSKKPWFTSPYILANTGYHHETSPGNDPPSKINDNFITAGLDIQHAVTNNMNLDLSFNTDFAQVEADDQVVNLSRFSLFFPEKRRFFLERSSILDFRFENENRLFYSRRVGINNGEVVPLWGGARLIGRIQDFDVGFMSMQSRGTSDFASENFGILRLRKKVSKNNSYVGAILTNRVDLDGHLKLSPGVDAILNIDGDDYLQMNFATSYDSGDNTGSSSAFKDRKRAFLLWENRSQVGLNYSLSFSQADVNYLPVIGFEERLNFKSFGSRFGYGLFLEKSEKWRYFRGDIDIRAFLTSSTNNLESFIVAPSLSLQGMRSSSLDLSVNYLSDNVTIPFNLSSNIEIAAGEYINTDITLGYQTPPVNFLNSNFSATIGTFYGGNRVTLGITPNYVMSKYVTLGGFYQYNRIGFDDQLYQAHVGRLKISTSFNVKLSLNAFIQMNTLTKLTAINVRLRYNSKDGNDLYIVYNESLNGDGADNLTIPYSDFRGLTLKYIHTFHL